MEVSWSELLVSVISRQSKPGCKGCEAKIHSPFGISAEYAKQAVAADKADNYPEAFELYCQALDHFKVHVKYEKNTRSREAITQKVSTICSCHSDMQQQA